MNILNMLDVKKDMDMTTSAFGWSTSAFVESVSFSSNHFQKLLKPGKILEDLEKGKTYPYSWKGDRSQVKNYRPGFLQGFVLGLWLFLVYRNDLLNGLQCNVKFFAENTSIFSVGHDSVELVNAMNKDLSVIRDFSMGNVI